MVFLVPLLSCDFLCEWFAIVVPRMSYDMRAHFAFENHQRNPHCVWSFFFFFCFHLFFSVAICSFSSPLC
jgi:hypothetical protein